MIALFDSLTLIQLGLRGAVPLGVLLLVGQLFSRHTRMRRSMSAVTALYLVAVLPIVALRVPTDVTLLSPVPLDAIFDSPTPAVTTPAPASEVGSAPDARPLALGEGFGDPPASPWSRRLILVYAAGAFLLLAIRGMAAVRLRTIVKHSVPLPGQGTLAESTATAMRLLKLGHADVRMSERVALPFVCGIWRAVVVLPREAETWPAERQLNVMLHELAHVRQHDVRWLAVWAVARALHWFNPLAWIAMRDFRLLSEQLSDGWVVRYTHSATDYARDLVALARHQIAVVTLSGALGLAHWSTLSTRIRAILAGAAVPRESRRRTLATVAGYVCVILPVGLITPVAQLPSEFPDLRSTMNVSTSPPDISSSAAGLQARWVDDKLHRGLFVTQDPQYLSIHTGVVPPRGSAMLIIEHARHTEVLAFGPGDRITLPEGIRQSLQRTVTSFQAERPVAGAAPTPAPPGNEFRPAYRSAQLGLPALSGDPGLAVTQAGWLKDSVRYAIMVRGPWRVHRNQVLPNDSGSWLVLQAFELATGETRRVELRLQDRRLTVNGTPAAMDSATEAWLVDVYQVLEALTPK